MKVSVSCKKDLTHLIKLLDDTDREILSIVEETIVQMGVEILPELHEELVRHYDNEVMSYHISHIIQKIHFKQIAVEIKKWLESYEHDLWNLLLIIDKLESNYLKNECVETFIDEVYKDVWLELNDKLTPLEKIKIINHILFDEYGFQGNKHNLHAVDNYLISKVVSGKKANSLVLGILFITIARKVGLPVCGVHLPMNFLVGYLNDLEIETQGKVNKILFYINPFEKGKLLNNFSVEEYLKRMKKYISVHQKEAWNVVTNRQIGYLLLKALSESYLKEKQEEKAVFVNRLLNLF